MPKLDPKSREWYLPYDLRFVFDGPLGEVLRAHCVRDMVAAKLSKSFQLYYRVRPFIPRLLRQILQRSRSQSMGVGERWYEPIEFLEEFADAIRRLSENQLSQRLLHPWPSQHRFAVSLTHDVETSGGLRHVDKLAAIEEKRGIRSAWFFVPYKYKIDTGLLSDLVDRGHEVGVHGYNHDGRLFTSKACFDKRAIKINQAADRFGASGFRAPMVHRNLTWMQALKVDYDASFFDADPFQAMPGGVGGMWPFIAGNLVELPYTLPQDHTLFLGLNEVSANIWLQKLALIRKMSGMGLLITHPDYMDCESRRDTYDIFLEHAASHQDAWLALPNQIATWWRDRDASTVLDDGEISGPAASRGRCTTLRELFPEDMQPNTELATGQTSS